MKTNSENPGANSEAAPKPAIKIFGIGGAGAVLLDALNAEEFAGAGLVAVNTDAASLSASSATVKVHPETTLLRGLGTLGGKAAMISFAVASPERDAESIHGCFPA